MAGAATRDSVLAEMRQLVQRVDRIQFDPEKMTVDARLEALGFDSLSILEYMYELESAFDIDMNVADLVEMETVQDLVDHVFAKLSE